MFAVSWCFLIMIRRPLVLTPTPPLCPYTPLFRSAGPAFGVDFGGFRDLARSAGDDDAVVRQPRKRLDIDRRLGDGLGLAAICGDAPKLCHTAIAALIGDPLAVGRPSGRDERRKANRHEQQIGRAPV